KISVLENASKKFKWALLMEDPAEEDIPPTLITNPKWINLIKPVFDIINTIPGYKEVDISSVFLIFFSVFFAMLIGDAGYGALIFIATAFTQFKFGKNIKNKIPLFLMYVLGVCTIIWGLFTGTVFGQQWVHQTVKPIIPWLTKDNNIKELCFLIGAAQLTIAHIWQAAKKAPSVIALADAGWVCVIWGAFFLARTLIIGTGFPRFAIGLFIAGLFFVVLFTIPPKNFFKGLFARFITIFLSVIGSFSDVVSYIRLFAVGMASVAIADAFNKMASDFGWSSLATGFITVIILVFGHGLNIILGAMAILVHGVRLNVLEFSSHLNMEWSGIEYNPFSGKKSKIGDNNYGI
ncbi:MAG: V-type ATP synthase subunit I, partial [Candidatus Auribacterota bacterium]|nr:V-type ATP synthase subunit I [Candidatus Auribacterota bacterium]